MRQVIVLSKYTPNVFLTGCLAIIPLMLLKPGKFVNQCLVDDKLMAPISPRGLVFMRTETFDKEASHLEIRVS